MRKFCIKEIKVLLGYLATIPEENERTFRGIPYHAINIALILQFFFSIFFVLIFNAEVYSAAIKMSASSAKITKCMRGSISRNMNSKNGSL